MAQLNKNVGKTFAFGEAKFGTSEIFRLDDLMRSQATQLLAEMTRIEKGTQKFFKGYAATSFDGVLKSVDLRGEIKRAYLVLSVGGHEIDCDITQVGLDMVRGALDNRATVTGLAFYRGDSGLPTNIEIRAIKLISKVKPDIARWRGAFMPMGSEAEIEWSRD
ncbi:hypothetical protein ASF32_00580 [Methylobacterium sp. Leaf91]|nr:hypothetical protein ASF32_00580 [Methylobacterium sp. Leaf91]